MKNSKSEIISNKISGSKVTVTDLAKLTGKQWRTCKDRIDKSGLKPIFKDKKSSFYDSFTALPVIFNIDTQSQNSKTYDLNEERAREAAMKADKLEIERDKLRGKLGLKSVFERYWLNIIVATRSKIKAFPYKITQKLDGIADGKIQQEVLKTGVFDLLIDLMEDLDENQEEIIQRVEREINGV